MWFGLFNIGHWIFGNDGFIKYPILTSNIFELLWGMEYPIDQFPCTPNRCLPSDYKSLSKFYHDLNPLSCDIYCSNIKCSGHINKLDLNYRTRNGNVFASCKVCRRAVECLPGNWIVELSYSI